MQIIIGLRDRKVTVIPPAVRVVALAICPKCKSEVTELTLTNPAICMPCWTKAKRKPQ